MERRRSAEGVSKTYEILFCGGVRTRRSAEQRSPGKRFLETDKLGLDGEFENEIKENDMKKLFVGLVILMCLGWFTGPTASNAQVSLDIHIGSPPLYEVPGPPEVVPIPGTYVYLVPGVTVDLLFYHGYWYRPHEGHWFRATSYNGPWHYRRQAPRALMQLPPNYRAYREPPPGYRRVPYAQARKNWRNWEKSKYWEHDEHWRRGSRSPQYAGPVHRQEQNHGPGYKDQGHGPGYKDQGHGPGYKDQGHGPGYKDQGHGHEKGRD
jgi:hypothetical protein